MDEKLKPCDDLISRSGLLNELYDFIDYNDDGEQQINADLVIHMVQNAISASRLEQQEERIAELEAENEHLRQEYISPETARVLMEDNERLEREIAAAKEDMHHNDACKVCVGSQKEVDGCDCECLTCKLDCRCKDCRDENKWEWRGAREGEGK